MGNTRIAETGTAMPLKRFGLKARVIGSGYESFTDFAEEVGVHRVYLSQVLNGHSFPSPALQRKMAAKLGLSLRELIRML